MLSDTLDTLFEHYQKSFPQLVTHHDPQWPSPCELGKPWQDSEGGELISWQPVRRHRTADDFAGLENALEIPIHPDIKAHYARYWSANLECVAPEGHVSLLFLWNQQDVDRLVENLIGHALACQQNRTPFSVFFACTDVESDLFLTVNNTSGVVQLESPGRKPLREVADNLDVFLQRLVPAREQLSPLI